MTRSDRDPRRHDLIVLGGGTGNSMVDDRFADWDVAIVEPRRLGGTCLNVGCIPTKMLVHTADIAAEAADSDRFGITTGDVAAEWTSIRDRVFNRIDARAENGFRARTTQRDNLTIYTGTARFLDSNRVSVTGADGTVTELVGDRIVVAVGGRPYVPSPFADGAVPFDTSDTIMRIDSLPERLVIVGGGYIAAEFAHVFSALGSAVTIVTRGERLLSSQDSEISELFTLQASRAWDVRTGRTVSRASGTVGAVELLLDDGTIVSGDRVLVAVGRIPNSDTLNLGAAGVRVHADGRIATDAFLRTSTPSVFAVGDVTGPHALKHVANRQGRVLTHNLLHPDDQIAVDLTVVPAAVFSRPQIASAGLTEYQAAQSGVDVAAYTHDYSAVAFGWALEDTDGRVKVLCDRQTGLLVGAHIIGPQASTLIQQLVQAMVFEIPVEQLARRQFWIHPALSEVVENALLGLVRKLDSRPVSTMRMEVSQ